MCFLSNHKIIIELLSNHLQLFQQHKFSRISSAIMAHSFNLKICRHLQLVRVVSVVNSHSEEHISDCDCDCSKYTTTHRTLDAIRI